MAARKKNMLAAVVLALLLVMLTAGITLAAPTITMTVDGQTIATDVAPYLQNNRTMVPVRYAAEPMGATLNWEGGSVQKATIQKGNDVVEITIGQTTAYVNGEAKTLDAPAEVKDGRTMVPLRFIAESLNAQVNWIAESQQVVIVSAGGNSDNSQSSNTDDYGRRSGPATPTTADNAGFRYIGYYYDSNSLKDLQQQTDKLTDVIHFGYELQEDGSIAEKANFSSDKFLAAGGGLELAQEAQLPALLLVTGFDKEVLTTVLTDASLRQTAVNNIVALVEEEGYDGADLDFEQVPAACRKGYVAFVKELKAALGEKTVSLSVTAKEGAYQTWLDGYDYAGLADAADWMIVMCYDQHYAGSEAGPVAGADWVEKVIQYMINEEGVAKDKLYIGLGLYGRAWGNGGSSNLAIINQIIEERNITVQYESGSEVPYFRYTRDAAEGERIVYYEDAYSVGVKAALVKRYQLAGIAIWRMGIVPDDVYQAIVDSRP